MANAKFDIKSVDIKTVQIEAQKSAERAFYAGVGVTDRAVEVLRTYLAEAQKRAQERFTAAQHDVTARVAGVQRNLSGFEPQALRAGLQTEALAVPGRVQKAVDANVANATDAYAGLVQRGEGLVTRIRRQQSTKDAVTAAETTVSKAKTTKTQATKAAKKSTADTRSSAKATSTAAKKTATAGAEAVVDAAEKVGD